MQFLSFAGSHGRLYNLPRSKLHEKRETCNDDPPSSFWDAGSFDNRLGTESPNCRTDRQDLWSGFVGTNRGGPLHLQPKPSRTQSQTLPNLDLGAQSQPSHL